MVHPEIVRQQLRQWAERATSLGFQDQFRDALRTIEARLSSEPTTWGDPLYPLAQLQLYVYRGIEQSIIVDYAVHDGERTVFVKRFSLLSNHPLERGG
jgi:hypothetical protein